LPSIRKKKGKEFKEIDFHWEKGIAKKKMVVVGGGFLGE